MPAASPKRVFMKKEPPSLDLALVELHAEVQVNSALAELPLIMVVGGLKTAAAPAPAPAYGTLAASPLPGHEADAAGAMLEAGECRPW